MECWGFQPQVLGGQLSGNTQLNTFMSQQLSHGSLHNDT